MKSYSVSRLRSSSAGCAGPMCIEAEDDAFVRTLAGRQRALRMARNVPAPLLPDDRS